MKSLKHIGKLKNTGAKVLVVFRTLPGESNQALVLPVAQLPDSYHDSIMALIETEEAQQSFEFGEIMFTRLFPDGRPMLRAMQADGRLAKMATDNVIMTPTPTTEIQLDNLNVLIAEQKNVAVDDLYTFVKGAPKKDDSVVQNIADAKELTNSDSPKMQAPNNSALSDKDIAKSLRSQADALYKEAARLRREAEDLDPIAKKTVKTKEDISA
jgi:hypothetical protein